MCLENKNINYFYQLDNEIRKIIYSYLWMNLIDLNNRFINMDEFKSIHWLSHGIFNIDYSSLIIKKRYIIENEYSPRNTTCQYCMLYNIITEYYDLSDLSNLLAFIWDSIKDVNNLITLCNKYILKRIYRYTNNSIIALHNIANIYLNYRQNKKLSIEELRYFKSSKHKACIFTIIDIHIIQLHLYTILYIYDKEFYNYMQSNIDSISDSDSEN
jgi:hypothetical protein